jgi:hypothetical protein
MNCSQIAREVLPKSEVTRAKAAATPVVNDKPAPTEARKPAHATGKKR